MAQEDNCNWGARGGGGGANPFILLHVMLKNYDTITEVFILLQPQQPQPYKSMELMVILPALQFLLRPCCVLIM